MGRLTEYREMIAEEIVPAMLEFLEDEEEAAATRADVRKCERILREYLKALERMKHPSDGDILEQVKACVFALNELNESTGDALIETTEREAIWEVIQGAAVESGLQNAEEDITEQWREW